MLRLLLCLTCATLMAATVVTLRQWRLQLQYECNALHGEILETQRELWRQQVQIAVATAPQALEAVLANQSLRKRPADPAPPRQNEPVLAGGDDWSVLIDEW